MLLEFRCKNFRSFKELASLSMLPVNAYKEHPENVISAYVPGSNCDGVLSSAVLYGTNASGKTNLLRAVDFARGLILNATPAGIVLPRNAFIGNPEPTEFGFSFLVGGERYEYDFSLDDHGVLEERLTARPKHERLVFQRLRMDDGSYETKQGSMYPGIAARLKGYTDKGLVLSMLSRFDIDACVTAIDWFTRGFVVSNRQAPIDYGTLINKLVGLGEDNFKRAVNAVRSADLGITGAQLSVDEMTEGERVEQKKAVDKLSAVFEALTGMTVNGIQMPEKKATFQFRHTIDGKGVGFGFDDESLGTVTMLDLAADLISAIDAGRTLCVDEAERSLHPVLLKNLVGLFSDSALNARGAQLIFTTHDLSFLSNDTLRRDQIWFVQKDADSGASELYPLSSFSPRKDENLTNRYLYGSYGAVPFIDGMLPDER